MELTCVSGNYNGRVVEASLPVASIIRQALLNLDYSQGVISNEAAAKQLSKQFCLSDVQRNIARDDGARLWLMRVNGAIQDLARSGEMVRTMRATIVTPEALRNMATNFFQELGYENVEVEITKHQGGICKAAIDIRTRTIQGEGLRFSVDATPIDDPGGVDDPEVVFDYKKEEPIMPRERQNERYWTQFCDYLNQRGSQLQSQTSKNEYYIDFRISIRGCSLRAMQVIKPPDTGIRVRFVLSGREKNYFFRILKEQQREIEEEFGEPLEWRERENENLVTLRKEADPMNENDWSRQYGWLATKLEKLDEVFRPRIIHH